MSQSSSSTMSQAAGPGSPVLLSGQFMHALDRLDVLSRKILSGKLQGDRRSKQRGQSVEFADYRPYVAGDDLRFIDWNLYARLDKLFLRLFMEEQDLSLTVALDVSRSMEHGQPRKSHYARQLAAALGYIGLVNHNRVSVFALAGSHVEALTHLRGRRPVQSLLAFLSGPLLPDAPTHVTLGQTMRKLAQLRPGKGLVVVVSDFLDKGDLGDALQPLASDQWDVHAIQTLSPQELDPARDSQLAGDLRLRDVEDGQQVEITLSPELLARYRANVQAYCQAVRQACLRRDVSYALADTAEPFETMVLQHLRQRGLLG